MPDLRTASDWRQRLKTQQYDENNRKKCQVIIDRLEAKEKKERVEKEKKRLQIVESRKRSLKNNYGITIEDYNTLLTQQGEKCAICGKHQSEFNYPLHIDHDHKTGKVRGLLCSGCNTGLGHFEKLHKEMQDYLKKHLTASAGNVKMKQR